MNGELWIKRIDYTGNSGLEPYNTIHFYYDERSDVKNYYISGKKITQQNLLREIVVKTNDKIIRRYNLRYAKDDLNESILSEIIESNNAGEQYNSTIINWGDNNLFNITPCTINVATNLRATFDKQYYSSCDVNGDGLSDLIGYFNYDEPKPNGTYNYDYIQIYTAESDENGSISFNLGLPYKLSTTINLDNYTAYNTGVMFGDLFGEGVTDIIVPRVGKDSEGTKAVLFNIRNRVDINNPYGLVITGLLKGEQKEPLLSVADIDNNGRANIIYLEKVKSDNYYNGQIHRNS